MPYPKDGELHQKERSWGRNSGHAIPDSVFPRFGNGASRDDPSRRESFRRDEKVFNRVMKNGEIFLKVSPTLLFEILFGKAVNDLREACYTVEKTRTTRMRLFHTSEVADLFPKRQMA
jgi:hypothetical protein